MRKKNLGSFGSKHLVKKKRKWKRNKEGRKGEKERETGSPKRILHGKYD